MLFSGLTFGSFVTCASYRLPLGQDVIITPSRCPKCETKLAVRDLWPVASWIMNDGMCRYCKSKISIRYPVIELITSTIFLLLYSQYGLTAQSIVLALMSVAMLIMIVADLEHYIIPDQIHLALAPLALIYHYIIGTPLWEAAWGFGLGLGTGLALHYGYRYLRKKEGLGFGDVKFFAVAGLWLTMEPFVPFLFFSGLFGIVTAIIWRLLGRGQVFPFGPALAVSLFLCVASPLLPHLFWNIGEIVAR